MRKIILLLLISFVFCSYAPIANAMGKEPVKTKKETPTPTKKLTKDQETSINFLINWKYPDDEKKAIKLIDEYGLDDPNYRLTKALGDVNAYTLGRVNLSSPIIHLAISNGFLELFNKLVNMPGIDINIQDREEGFTLLHRAITSEKLKEPDREKIIEILINKGADPDIPDRYGKKPIEYAGKEIYEKIKKLMIPDPSKITKTSPTKITKKVETTKTTSSEIKKIGSKKYTKTYSDGTIANAFDVGILLDSLDFFHSIKGKSSEEVYPERISTSNKLDNIGPFTTKLLYFIKSKEAVIVSTPLVLNACNLYDLSLKNLLKNLDDQDLVKTAINELFEKDNFSIFATNDREFVFLIPNSKYQEIKAINNLSTIGLNPDKFYKIKDSNEETPTIENIEKKIKEIHDNLFKNQESRENKSSAINIKSLLDIFLDKPIVDIRVFLGGHGLETFKGALLARNSALDIDKDEQTLLIANMKPSEYTKLRNKLDSSRCSFLYVCSCFIGSTIHRVQSGNLNEMLDAPQSQPKHKMPEKPKILSSKKFIEIAEGIPGTATTAGKKPINFDQFFLKINEFFTKEKKAIIKQLDEDKNINLDVKNSILNNLNEQQVLTGKFGSVNLEPVITKNKDIKTSTIFLDIFKDFVPRQGADLPRVRFPGDTKMSPIRKLYPELDKKYEETAKKILENKEHELKNIKKAIEDYETNWKLQQHGTKEYYENEKKILEDTIRQLEEDYLPKNTILEHKKDQLSRLYGKINTTKDVLKRKPSSENAQKWENEIKDFENSAQALETRIKELEKKL